MSLPNNVRRIGSSKARRSSCNLSRNGTNVSSLVSWPGDHRRRSPATLGRRIGQKHLKRTTRSSYAPSGSAAAWRIEPVELEARHGEPVAEMLDAAKRHIGELSMEIELLRERARAAEQRLPLAMRRSRR